MVPSQNQSPSAGNGDATEDEDVYLVETILDETSDDDGVQYFLVKWQGYPEDEATWEPEDNILDTNLIAEWRTKKTISGRRHNHASSSDTDDTSMSLNGQHASAASNAPRRDHTRSPTTHQKQSRERSSKRFSSSPQHNDKPGDLYRSRELVISSSKGRSIGEWINSVKKQHRQSLGMIFYNNSSKAQIIREILDLPAPALVICPGYLVRDWKKLLPDAIDIVSGQQAVSIKKRYRIIILVDPMLQIISRRFFSGILALKTSFFLILTSAYIKEDRRAIKQISSVTSTLSVLQLQDSSAAASPSDFEYYFPSLADQLNRSPDIDTMDDNNTNSQISQAPNVQQKQRQPSLLPSDLKEIFSEDEPSNDSELYPPEEAMEIPDSTRLCRPEHDTTAATLFFQHEQPTDLPRQKTRPRSKEPNNDKKTAAEAAPRGDWTQDPNMHSLFVVHLRDAKRHHGILQVLPFTSSVVADFVDKASRLPSVVKETLQACFNPTSDWKCVHDSIQAGELPSLHFQFISLAERKAARGALFLAFHAVLKTYRAIFIQENHLENLKLTPITSLFLGYFSPNSTPLPGSAIDASVPVSMELQPDVNKPIKKKKSQSSDHSNQEKSAAAPSQLQPHAPQIEAETELQKKRREVQAPMANIFIPAPDLDKVENSSLSSRSPSLDLDSKCSSIHDTNSKAHKCHWMDCSFVTAQWDTLKAHLNSHLPKLPPAIQENESCSESSPSLFSLQFTYQQWSLQLLSENERLKRSIDVLKAQVALLLSQRRHPNKP